MKVMKLNESQYKKLFEGYKDLGDENPSSVPTVVGGSEAATMITGGEQGDNGETEFVNKNKSRKRNYLRGAGMKQDPMGKQYPFGFTNMGGRI